MDKPTVKSVFNALYKILSVAIIITSLVACGGSGSTSSSDDNTSSTPDSGEETKNDPATPIIDITPDIFSFFDQANIDFLDTVESNIITIKGLDKAVAITIIGGEYAINEGAFTTTSGSINSGQSVKLRVTAANSFNTTHTATLTIGGISADFNVTTVLDTSAPEVSIIFPFPSFSTTSSNIKMRGTASDPEGSKITSLIVGGVEATSDDGFATWQASVPVPLGRTTITVTVQDIEGNIDTNAASVSAATGNAPDAFVTPRCIKFDRENNRAFVIDSGLDVLMAVDLTTRERIILSSSDVGEGPNFQTPTGLDFDIENNRIFVTDSEAVALFAVDLVTGDRTIVTNNSVGEDAFLRAPKGVAFDIDNDRALLLDDDFGIGKVYAVDLTTGARNQIDLSGVSIRDVTSIALDSANGRALVTDTKNNSLTSINLTTGERAFLSATSSTSVGGGDNDFDSPMSVDIDIENNRALVVDPTIDELGVLFGVDLTTGFRQVLSGPKRDGGYVGTGQFRTDLETPVSVVLNTNSGEALLLNAESNSLLKVGLGNGDVKTISAITESILLTPTGLALDKDSRKAFTTDLTRSALISIDLETGTKGFPSTGSNTAQGPEPELPLSLAYNPDNNSVFLTDSLLGLLTVDLFTGNRTIVSSDNIGGGNVDFSSPRSVVLDTDNNRVLVLSLGSIAAVNLSTGRRTLVSGAGKGEGPTFNTAIITSDSMVLDKENNRVFVSSAKGFILEVDLETGDRTTFTGENLGEGVDILAGGPDGLALDTDNNRLIVMLSKSDALISVDLTSRDRTILSGLDVGGGTDFLSPSDIVLDENDIVLVIDTGVDEVIAVDLITGERAIINK
jgi:sugar lactone lactonase YvrE